MDVALRERIGLAGDDGRGRLGKQSGKHWFPHFRTSPVRQAIWGSCTANHGQPRMMSVLASSRTRSWMFSSCRVIGPARYLTLWRLIDFPVMDWIWYVFGLTAVGILSWRQRLPDMKLPADPESRRAWTGREIWWVISVTTIVSGDMFWGTGWMELTNSLGGRVHLTNFLCFWQYGQVPNLAGKWNQHL